MSTREKLLSSGIILTLRVSTMGAKLLLSLFIARYLGLEELGLYGMVAGAAAIVPTALRGGVMNAVTRNAVSTPPEVTGSELSHYALVVGSTYLFLIALVSLADVLPGFTFLLLLSSGAIAAEHVTQDLYNLSNSLQAPRRANVILFCSRGLWPIGYMLFALAFEPLRSIEAILTAWSISIMPALLAARPLLRRLKWPAPWPTFAAAARWFHLRLLGSVRLFVGELANTMSFYVDRYLIALFIDLGSSGLYVLFWQVGSAVYNLANAGSMQVYRPKLIAAHDSEDYGSYKRIYSTCLKWTIAETLLIALVALLAFPVIFALFDLSLASDQFALLFVVLLGVLVRVACDLAGYLLYTRRRDAQMMLGYLLLLTLTVLLTPIGVMSAGTYGAATATILAYFLVLLFRVGAAR